MTDVQELWTRKQAADYLHKKPNTLAVWACTKRYNLPYIKIGRSVLYKPSDVIALVNNSRMGGES